MVKNLRKVLWYLILALPLLAFALSFVMNSTGFLSFDSFMTTNFGVLQSNVVYDTIAGIFGQGGILPMFSSGVISYFVYFIGIELVHIIMDVLLFLPTLIHNFFDRLGGRNDY